MENVNDQPNEMPELRLPAVSGSQIEYSKDFASGKFRHDFGSRIDIDGRYRCLNCGAELGDTNDCR
jgi:hypothetical protein